MSEVLSTLWAQADSILALLVAAVLGGVIGLEREHQRKPAGFRTNLLICLGAALITDLCIAVAEGPTGAGAPDPGRIAAQIVSGVGFLGAGTIIQSRGSVRGLTTAATLWVVAGIGMAVGAREYVLAVSATLLVFAALEVLGRIDEHIAPAAPSDRIIQLELEPNLKVLSHVQEILSRGGLSAGALEVEKKRDVFVVAMQSKGAPDALKSAVEQLLDLEGVRKVSLA
jgi:putative Mg2+ transporter-C (MgtC) family protein